MLTTKEPSIRNIEESIALLRGAIRKAIVNLRDEGIAYLKGVAKQDLRKVNFEVDVANYQANYFGDTTLNTINALYEKPKTILELEIQKKGYKKAVKSLKVDINTLLSTKTLGDTNPILDQFFEKYKSVVVARLANLDVIDIDQIAEEELLEQEEQNKVASTKKGKKGKGKNKYGGGDSGGRVTSGRRSQQDTNLADIEIPAYEQNSFKAFVAKK